jgi:hypothetical protein
MYKVSSMSFLSITEETDMCVTVSRHARATVCVRTVKPSRYDVLSVVESILQPRMLLSVD